MDKSIKEIHLNNLILLGCTDKMVYHFRTQNYDAALRMSDAVLELIVVHTSQLQNNSQYFITNGLTIDFNALSNTFQELLEAQRCKDYLMLSDLYEVQYQPFLYLLQGIILQAEAEVFDQSVDEENMEALKLIDPALSKRLLSIRPDQLLKQGYSLELTDCGLMTVALMEGNQKYYLHSNHDVLKEGFSLAKSWYSEDNSEYVIYGLGLGYHIEEFADLDINHSTEVYESDINIIRLACACTYFKKLINHHNIKLIYDPDFSLLFQRLAHLDQGAEFLIHAPSLRNIKDKSIKDKMENYFIQYSSIKNQLKLLNANFNRNIMNYDHLVDDLQEVFRGKDLYIVAAGPSLDKNFTLLKDIDKKDSIILATGTVFRKLVKADILPDYFIVIDANSRVLGQIGGLLDVSVPMLLLSTAYYDFAKIYKGKKYIICQKDYSKAEAYAAQKGARLFQSGGSVSTAALDIGLQFGCKRIIFLGLDLAYTNNFKHTTEASQRDLSHTDDLRLVEDIDGNMIYTSKSLDIYRVWIENRIKDIKDVEIIDATEGGAKIAGMKIKKLSECINTQE